MTIKIGEAAAAINVAIIIAQITFPLALVVILIGIVKDDSNAATWSVVGRLLNGSLWTSILGADAAPNKKVSRRVVFISTVSTVGLLVLAIAGAITPLGLSYADVYVSTKSISFRYAADPSPMGLGTLGRPGYNANRLCFGSLTPLNCPGQAHGYRVDNFPNGSVTVTSDTANDYFSSIIPSNVTDIFKSATSGDSSTVAGFFDIEFRSFAIKSNPNITVPSNVTISQGARGLYYDPGNKTAIGVFQMFSSLIQTDDYFLVEGLIVDTKTAAIGFRNHTVPASTGGSIEWQEDILFLQPDTACVNTNLSLEYTLPVDSLNPTELLLTDRGGLVHLTRDYPYIDLNDTQRNPNLQARSWKGAVLNNYNLLLYFNETRNATALGKQYNLGNQTSFSPNNFLISEFARGPVIPGVSISTEFDPNFTIYPGANITDYLTTGLVTQGFGGGDLANITNIAASTGIFLGAGIRVDGMNGSRLDPGSKWTMPLYTCSSAIYASIKSVTFVGNGTSGLKDVHIQSISDKVYADNASTPLWAVEKTGYNISEIAPIWGLVDNKYEHLDSLQTIRSSRFYLPAAADSIFGTFFGFRDALAAGRVPATALKEAYSPTTSSSYLLDYSGRTNYPLFLKWQKLGASVTTVPMVLNLIWTDLMANALVGTTSNKQNEDLSGNSKEAKVLQRKIKYDLRYAIPAIIFAVLYVIVLLWTLGMLVLRKSHIHTLKTLLNNTAVGRAVTNERFPGVVKREAQTSEWVKELGDVDIGIRKANKSQAAHGAAEVLPSEKQVQSPVANESQLVDEQSDLVTRPT